MGRPIKRTVQVCLSDLPKDKIVRPANGKAYISLTLWDMDYYDNRDQNVQVQVTATPEDMQNNTPPLVVGGGLIHQV